MYSPADQGPKNSKPDKPLDRPDEERAERQELLCGVHRKIREGYYERLDVLCEIARRLRSALEKEED